jgi:hypothetical protein
LGGGELNLVLEYGLVKEYDEYDLWFEPITDTNDGFVIKSKDDEILEMYELGSESCVVYAE